MGSFLMGDFYSYAREVIERPAWDLHLGVTWVWRESGTYITQPIMKYSGAPQVQRGLSEPVSLQSGHDTICFVPEGDRFLMTVSS